MSLCLVYGPGKMKTNNETIDQLWTNLSSGEKDFIRALIWMVQGAKRSQVIEVARAARKWESGLAFFFKVRLRNQRPRRSASVAKGQPLTLTDVQLDEQSMIYRLWRQQLATFPSSTSRVSS